MKHRDARRAAKRRSAETGALWWVIVCDPPGKGWEPIAAHPDFGEVFEITDVYSNGEKMP